ncbi:cytochrome and DOMON domain-containing protein [Aspergillus ibericus CBS 121593]|uniref:CBD9-like protein n=1 Tax=Aspergillus ibericus CBS 121593 TaxID=1448316 RepID=A0A395GMI0_9EURO|nr:CBD9-like protein [Aspergillus ibericus CBS 121593]RAK96037.1 CBD9-like protein [Aspergillus ibericus CBS 121593]
MKWLTFLLVTLNIGIGTSSIISFSPPTNPSIIYSLTIPNTTTLSTPGPIYLQITAPTTLQWIGLGQGAQMTGANMFLLYTSSASKITLSPRSGLGHFEPQYTSSTQLTLLPGTGITNNGNGNGSTMTANLRCDNCLTWQDGTGRMSPLDPDFPFIWAYKVGVPINSAALDADLSIHDEMGQVRVDLTKAALPDTFYTSSSSLGWNESGSSSSSNLSTLTNPFASYNPSTDSISALSTPTPTGPHIPKNMKQVLIAHATLMALAFAILFPMGGMIMPLPVSLPVQKITLHRITQLLTLSITLAGFGAGVYIAHAANQLRNPHPIIGMIVVGVLVLVQPILGILQHRNFKKGNTGGPFGVCHRWVGRGAMVLGMVNGGLGFRLAGVGGVFAPKGAVVGYAVVVGGVGILYLGVLLWDWGVKGRRDEEREGGVGGEGERDGGGGKGEEGVGEKPGVVMEER